MAETVPEVPGAAAADDEKDPLLALRGSGKQLWADEHADEYVERLRRWDSVELGEK